MANIGQYVDKAFENKDFAELAGQPIDVLQGVSAADAEAIKKALNIKTVRDLAEHKAIRAAQAITMLAGK
jgi:ABC-type amino acid transport substrate-binding protein